MTGRLMDEQGAPGWVRDAVDTCRACKDESRVGLDRTHTSATNAWVSLREGVSRQDITQTDRGALVREVVRELLPLDALNDMWRILRMRWCWSTAEDAPATVLDDEVVLALCDVGHTVRAVLLRRTDLTETQRGWVAVMSSGDGTHRASAEAAAVRTFTR